MGDTVQCRLQVPMESMVFGGCRERDHLAGCLLSQPCPTSLAPDTWGCVSPGVTANRVGAAPSCKRSEVRGKSKSETEEVVNGVRWLEDSGRSKGMRCCCGRQVSLETLARIRPKSKLRAAATWLGTPTSYRKDLLPRRIADTSACTSLGSSHSLSNTTFDNSATKCLEPRSHSTCDTSMHPIYANDSVFHMAMLTVS